MSDIDASNSCRGKALDSPEAGGMRTKAQYVMRIGLLHKTGHLSNTEAAQKLGLSQEELSEMLRGQRCDLTVAKISEYLSH